MPWEVWYIPFFGAGVNNNSFLGEAHGYLKNTTKHAKLVDLTPTSETYDLIVRKVVNKKGQLKTYDKADTKLIIMGHCEPDGVSLSSDPGAGRNKFHVSPDDLVTLLYDEEKIRNIRNIQIFACHSAAGANDGKWSFVADFGHRMAQKLDSLEKVSGYLEKLDRPALQFGSKTAKGNIPAREKKKTYTRNELLNLYG